MEFKHLNHRSTYFEKAWKSWHMLIIYDKRKRRKYCVIRLLSKINHIVAVLVEFNLFVTEKTFCTAINWKINYFLVIAFLWTFFGPFWSILSWSCCFWDFYFLKIHDNPNNSLSRLIVDYHWSFPLFFSLSTKTKGAISFRVCYFGLCGSLHVQWNF